MTRYKAKLAGQREFHDTALGRITASCPPAPSRSSEFIPVHDELAVIQNIARVFLSRAVEPFSEGRWLVWEKFTTEVAKHRNLQSTDEIEKFLSSKLISKRQFHNEDK